MNQMNKVNARYQLSLKRKHNITVACVILIAFLIALGYGYKKYDDYQEHIYLDKLLVIQSNKIEIMDFMSSLNDLDSMINKRLFDLSDTVREDVAYLRGLRNQVNYNVVPQRMSMFDHVDYVGTFYDDLLDVMAKNTLDGNDELYLIGILELNQELRKTYWELMDDIQGGENHRALGYVYLYEGELLNILESIMATYAAELNAIELTFDDVTKKYDKGVFSYSNEQRRYYKNKFLSLFPDYNKEDIEIDGTYLFVEKNVKPTGEMAPENEIIDAGNHIAAVIHPQLSLTGITDNSRWIEAPQKKIYHLEYSFDTITYKDRNTKLYLDMLVDGTIHRVTIDNLNILDDAYEYEYLTAKKSQEAMLKEVESKYGKVREIYLEVLGDSVDHSLRYMVTFDKHGMTFEGHFDAITGELTNVESLSQ